MVIKNTNIFYSKELPNFTQSGIFGLKFGNPGETADTMSELMAAGQNVGCKAIMGSLHWDQIG
jgi:hypothetical protein